MDDLTGKDLKWAYWYNTHHDVVGRIAYGVGIGLVSLLWLINLLLFIQYLISQRSTNVAVNQIANTSVIYDSIKAPQDLTIIVTAALANSPATIDVYAQVRNPNNNQVGRFSYLVQVSGERYEFFNEVIMPGASNDLVIANIPGTSASVPTISIANMIWERVRGPQVQTEFYTNDLAITRSNLTAADDTTVTQLTSTLTNASAYGFRRVVITGLLRNTAGVVVAAQQIVLTNVRSFSDTALTFVWARAYEFNATAEITITTNSWDQDNLILPGQN